MQTFYWYDLETWGLDPRFYPPAQFAGIRTDMELNVIGEPLVLFNKPSPDMLPQPQAVLTTGITPQQALEKGLSETEFIAQIYAQLAMPNTISVGFNSIRFDDEMLRYTFYRNLYDPYEREYANGNGRWDIIDLARAIRVLKPEGLQWPVVEGENSNRLEELTKANGISHDNAHDALADVKATIDLARLLKQKQPELYAHAFKLSNKQIVQQMLELALREQQPLLHTTGKFRNENLNTSLILILGQHPQQRNKYITYDLRFDHSSYMNLNDVELQTCLFGTAEERGKTERLAVKEIHIGKSPFIASSDWLDEECAKRINLDSSVVEKNRQALVASPDFIRRIIKLFTDRSIEPHPDVDAQLYGGDFPSDQEKTELARVRALPIKDWESINLTNPKYLRLLRRYRARNFFDDLPPEEQSAWQKFCQQKLTQDQADWMTFPELERQLTELLTDSLLPDDKKYLLEEIRLYAESIYLKQEY